MRRSRWAFTYYSFIFFLSSCHQDQSSNQLHHDWNMSSGKDWHSVGVCSFCILAEMITLLLDITN